MLEIAFAKPALPRKGALVLPLPEGGPGSVADGLAGLAASLDSAMGGGLARALGAAQFKGRKGQSITLWHPLPEGGPAKLVVLGMGAAEALDARAAELLGGTILPAIAAEPEALIATESLTAPVAAALAMGVLLRSWRFDRYRTREKAEDKPKLNKVTLAVADAAAARSAFVPLKAVVDGVFITRELVAEPANVLTPAVFADRARQLEKLGIEVEVLGPKEMKKLGFGALLGVAQGSVNEPRLVVMQWHGATPKDSKKKGRPVAFIGKGVTFDTGGISIKPAGGMEDMKWDMAGAGCVTGLMAALAGRKAKVDAVGILGLVENMPSGNAQRPGDVVTSASGQTIEVINTDAEGRLVLADALWYCRERFDPRFMIDLATLTGAIIVALGHEHAGLFSNDDTLANQLMAAGTATGEKCWRMPMGDAYDKQLKSEIADMKNVTGRPGSSITAAQFIQRFIGKPEEDTVPWAHLDIAGMAWSGKDSPTTPKGATAYGVRLLERLVAEHYEG